MFRKKTAAPQTLPQKTCLYQKRLQESLRIETVGGRYQALALLLDDIAKDLVAREKTFGVQEDRRIVGTLLGMGAGIPLVAGAAALAGAPLAILVLVPAVMSSGIYASHKHRQAAATFLRENQTCMPAIARIRAEATAAQDHILKHQAAALEAAPQHPDLVKACPRLRAYFDAAGTKTAATKPTLHPRPQGPQL
jgi:hypothetical protein